MEQNINTQQEAQDTGWDNQSWEEQRG